MKAAAFQITRFFLADGIQGTRHARPCCEAVVAEQGPISN